MLLDYSSVGTTGSAISQTTSTAVHSESRPLGLAKTVSFLLKCRSASVRNDERLFASEATHIGACQRNDVSRQPRFVLRPCGALRCVERCCPSALQARRSEMSRVR